MHLNDFNFDLPTELIARYPLEKRSNSRLLCVEKKGGDVSHRQFAEVVDLIEPGDLLVFNDTKVIPARLRGKKKTGGRVELLVERVLTENRFLAQIRASKSLRVGEALFFPEDISFSIINRHDRFFEVKSEFSIFDILERIGEIPLPPYMKRIAEEEDRVRYQTIYAAEKGSVAAPTAGLHFDQEIMKQLSSRKVEMGYLTLHIGAGTFLPVRVDEINQHQMHAEYFKIDNVLCEKIKRAKANNKRIIAVGTTSLRALETVSQQGEIQPYSGETSIFIYPGYRFHCVNALITNLHLPRSTLIMLVAALGGYENIMNAYQSAINNGYRFYSYGDAMWIG